MITEILINEDLSLSGMTPGDLEDLVHYLNDPVVYANTLTVPYPYTMEDAEDFLAHVLQFRDDHGFLKDWVIRLDGKLIGGIGALYNYGVDAHRTEIGYWIARDFRGKGYGTQSIGAYVRHIFRNTPMIRLEAHVFTGNNASAKSLEKNGFVLEGTHRATYVKDGKPRDTWQYALVKEGAEDAIDAGLRSGWDNP